MANGKAALTVEQHRNPRHVEMAEKDDSANPEFVYLVTRACNTLIEKIGAWLTPARVQALIEEHYVNVTIIQPVQKGKSR